jgi:hypothetical protein
MGYRASTQGAEFAATTIKSVAAPWSADALIDKAAPEFLQSTPRGKVPAFVSFVAARLGSLKTLGTVETYQWETYIGPGGPAVFTWHYSDCEFENGNARITVQLIRRGQTWKIVAFNVDSDILAQEPSQTPHYKGTQKNPRSYPNFITH